MPIVRLGIYIFILILSLVNLYNLFKLDKHLDQWAKSMHESDKKNSDEKGTEDIVNEVDI